MEILQKHNLKIGDILVIKNTQWKIADVRNDIVFFYREGIDGSSRVQEVNEDELNEILQKQPR
ncbi:MAG: hypothetical protein KAK01_11390 [Candidatus Marinimicrobia bacterium]|nr:hypothetical protein [Candidatus Neomarinimicrobiota bacterium]